jgi:hypothetical protein
LDWRHEWWQRLDEREAALAGTPPTTLAHSQKAEARLPARAMRVWDASVGSSCLYLLPALYKRSATRRKTERERLHERTARGMSQSLSCAHAFTRADHASEQRRYSLKCSAHSVAAAAAAA